MPFANAASRGRSGDQRRSLYSARRTPGSPGTLGSAARPGPPARDRQTKTVEERNVFRGGRTDSGTPSSFGGDDELGDLAQRHTLDSWRESASSLSRAAHMPRQVVCRSAAPGLTTPAGALPAKGSTLARTGATHLRRSTPPDDSGWRLAGYIVDKNVYILWRDSGSPSRDSHRNSPNTLTMGKIVERALAPLGYGVTMDLRGFGMANPRLVSAGEADPGRDWGRSRLLGLRGPRPLH